ncbi:MAG: hypothetical protein ACI8Z1_003986 [Candidatus Azotimanducaceae bacterium]|jgi:hypothetical protein
MNAYQKGVAEIASSVRSGISLPQILSSSAWEILI